MNYPKSNIYLFLVPKQLPIILFMLLEICTNSLQSAINAQNGGAHRIELCCNLENGGLTPSYATIRLAKKWLDIEVFVFNSP